jgi:hypothetical protein
VRVPLLIFFLLALDKIGCEQTGAAENGDEGKINNKQHVIQPEA